MSMSQQCTLQSCHANISASRAATGLVYPSFSHAVTAGEPLFLEGGSSSPDTAINDDDTEVCPTSGIPSCRAWDGILPGFACFRTCLCGRTMRPWPAPHP